jgi:hypothetical protein
MLFQVAAATPAAVTPPAAKQQLSQRLSVHPAAHATASSVQLKLRQHTGMLVLPWQFACKLFCTS